MPHTLVFCNTIEACRRVENALRRADRRGHAYRLWVYHSAVNAEGRQRALQQFAQPQAEVGADGAPLPRLLVCTDRASRGMDFPQAAALHNLAPPAAACACAFVLHVHVHVHVLHVHVRIRSACARVHARVHRVQCTLRSRHMSPMPPMPLPRCLAPDASPPMPLPPPVGGARGALRLPARRRRVRASRGARHARRQPAGPRHLSAARQAGALKRAMRERRAPRASALSCPEAE